MIVRDLFHITNEERVIARAIFEDRCKPEDINDWITKYYAQLIKLKNVKVHKSKYMLYLTVDDNDNGREMGIVSGFDYYDIKAGNEIFYSVEYFKPKDYASMFVPDHTVERYGAEAVAAEALREYGWNGFDANIECPDAVRLKVLKELSGMKQELFLMDSEYFDRCRKQFQKYYEGKEVPHWKDAKIAEGVADHRSSVPHLILI